MLPYFSGCFHILFSLDHTLIVKYFNKGDCITFFCLISTCSKFGLSRFCCVFRIPVWPTSYLIRLLTVKSRMQLSVVFCRSLELEHILNLVPMFFQLTLNMQISVSIIWYDSLKFANILKIHNSNPLGTGCELSVHSTFS